MATIAPLGGWVERTCPECGAGFRKGPQAIYCGRPCAVAAGNHRRLRKVRVDDRCGVCRTPFQSENYQTKYCSKSCKNQVDNLAKRLKIHGITRDAYMVLLAKQENRCAICRSEDWGFFGIPRIDHDHETGVVRGLLCNDCNLGLGLLGDTLQRIEAAFDYIKGNR